MCYCVVIMATSLHVFQSVIVKEHYLNVKIVLQKLRYSEHNWAICVDFKMVNFLLGQQGVTPYILVFSVTGTVALLISTG